MRIVLIFLFVKYNSHMDEKNSKEILSNHNVSITNPRILVVEALLETKNPVTIEELQAML